MPKAKKQSDEETPKKTPTKVVPNVITYLDWTAPGRPFEKKTKQFFSTTILLGFLGAIIIFFFAGPLGSLTIIALTFVAYVFNSIPPRDFHYRITSEGVRFEEHFYLWQELYDFYFKRRGNTIVLHIRTKSIFPGELTFSLNHYTPEQVKSVLIRFLPFREYVKPTSTEKVSNWLARNFPMAPEKASAKPTPPAEKHHPSK